MEFIDNIFKVYGLKITIIVLAIIGLCYIFKLILEKILIDKTNIKRIKAENEYQRKTMAFKILIEKELEFYEKYYEYASKFITYIQDITFNLNKGNFETYINYTIKILELIPLFKRDVLLYESYCDNQVLEGITSLITYLQDIFLPKLIKDKKQMKNNEHLLDNDCDNLLLEFSVVNTLIKKREQDMVES